MRDFGSIPILIIGALSAVIIAGCGSSGGRADAGTGGPAPDCVPQSYTHDAALASGRVDVSPAPGTVSANPHTQISFLGVPIGEIHDVRVSGSRTGPHSGDLKAYSQGDGASFLPSAPFDPGETVTVHATIGGGGQAARSSVPQTAGGPTAGAQAISFSFRVATPYSTSSARQFPNPTANPSEYRTFHTLPGVQAPILTVTHEDEDPAAGDIFTTNGPGPGSYGPLIYTPKGRLVWFHQLSGGKVAEDLNVQEYEGSPHITYWQGEVITLGFGLGEDVVLNNRYETVATVKGGNGLKADLHDFELAGNHVAYITALNPIRCNLSSLGGSANGVLLDNAIQEIDMKTGLVMWEWHSVDHIPLSASETSPNKGRPWDWLHLNSIDPERSGDLLISARNSWAVYQIQAGSGEILWTLGGNKSSFKMGPGTKTAWQHDARMLPNGEITIFDDGANPPVHSQSRAIRVRLNFATKEATLTSSYTHGDPPLLAASQGDVQWLANGDAVVGYGGVPWVSEYNSVGKLIYDAHLPLSMASYRDYRYPWQAQPATRPALVANLNNTGEETIVHMSWNGATDVASWRILAGMSRSSVQATATVPDTGFETSTLLPKRYSYVQVQALSSTGETIGTSSVKSVESYASSFDGEHADPSGKGAK